MAKGAAWPPKLVFDVNYSDDELVNHRKVIPIVVYNTQMFNTPMRSCWLHPMNWNIPILLVTSPDYLTCTEKSPSTLFSSIVRYAHHHQFHSNTSIIVLSSLRQSWACIHWKIQNIYFVFFTSYCIFWQWVCHFGFASALVLSFFAFLFFLICI